jgi:NAD+ synthase (glutamine-hydrolysing)
MSHYHVNASVPKTLIQYLIGWAITTKQFGPEVNALLQAILETQISPELVPTPEHQEEGLQATETVIGPYALQDFNLYYISRFGFGPKKVSFLAEHAWSDKRRGRWPDGLPESHRQEYSLATITQWLQVFLERFIQTQQFKRSCLPNGPKVGSGGSLSPRSDWRAPSDAEANVWLQEVREEIPDSGTLE